MRTETIKSLESFDREISKQVAAEIKGNVVTHTCYECGGAKYIFSIPCPCCHGLGTITIQY